MFLEIRKDIRTDAYVSHKLVSKEEMVEKHPYNLDLRGWSVGGRMNTRFGFSNQNGKFLYVKTEETDTKKLEALVKKFV